jgi:hypothetical protein
MFRARLYGGPRSLRRWCVQDDISGGMGDHALGGGGKADAIPVEDHVVGEYGAYTSSQGTRADIAG